MTAPVLFLEHDELDEPHRFAEILDAERVPFQRVRLHLGMELPEDPIASARAVVSLGGHQNVDEQHEHPWIARELAFLRRCHDAHVPVLGVCLGAQLLAVTLGGAVARAPAGPEIGLCDAVRTQAGAADAVIGALPASFRAMQCHAYEVRVLPPAASPALAASARTAVQAFRVGRSLGVQFHFEWTRAAIDAMLAQDREFALAAGYDPDLLQAEVERDFACYRAQGDRLMRAWLREIRA